MRGDIYIPISASFSTLSDISNNYLHWERCAYCLIRFSEDQEEMWSETPYRNEGGSECGKEVEIEGGSVGRR